MSEIDPAVKGFQVASWNALAAPAKTPPATIARLGKAVNAALADGQVQQRLQSLGVVAQGSTPAQMAALLQSEIQRWAEVIERAGVARQ